MTGRPLTFSTGLPIVCAGAEVDPSPRTVRVLGRMLPVTGVTYSAGHGELPGSWRVSTPEQAEITALIYVTPEEIAAAIARPIRAMPEVVHFNAVCENGWWVEVALWVEEDTMSFGLPPRGLDPLHSGTASDLLALYDEVCERPGYVPGDEYDDPWGGLAPGEWDIASFDDLHESAS